jgi:hypothetical protein
MASAVSARSSIVANGQKVLPPVPPPPRFIPCDGSSRPDASPIILRPSATTRIEATGDKISGSVSKKTDYVGAGVEAEAKLDKVQKLEVGIIDEAELLRLCVG